MWQFVAALGSPWVFPFTNHATEGCTVGARQLREVSIAMRIYLAESEKQSIGSIARIEPPSVGRSRCAAATGWGVILLGMLPNDVFGAPTR